MLCYSLLFIYLVGDIYLLKKPMPNRAKSIDAGSLGKRERHFCVSSMTLFMSALEREMRPSVWAMRHT